MRYSLICLLLLAGSDSVIAQKSELSPPTAATQPARLEEHGHVRVDEYFWLNQREDPQVIEYLAAENEYTKSAMSSVSELEEKLFAEAKARIKEDDSSVPYADRGYMYYTRFEEGQQYPIYCRKADAADGSEQVMLDVNQLAQDQPYCAAAGVSVSAENDILAYAVDFVGRRIYTLRFKNLETGELLEDAISNVTGNVTWAEDNKTIFYTRQDPTTLRSYQVYRHVLGQDPSEDELVFEETDETFSCYAYKSRSRKFVIIASQQTLSSEARFVDALDPTSEFRVFHPREPDHEYSLDHLDDEFFVKTNWGAKNFRLMKSGLQQTQKSNWQDVVPHRDDVLLEGFTLFKNYLVVDERREGLTRVRIIPWSGAAPHELDFGEETYAAYVNETPDPDTDWLRYGYTSMTTPGSTFQYNMKSREKELLKQTPVLGGFQAADYKTQRLWATARDGTRVPVSVVYHVDTKIDGSAPCVLYGYGSYGSSIDATFSASRLSLLSRGFVYAIAHIRGGQELGRQWYEDGKLLKKKNTFTDFIDVGEFLIEQGYAHPEQLYARGGSAGGLLIGAVVNMKPELFHGVVAAVPFVDVVTTMLDDSIPLTTSEYDEWGNPNDKEYYDYMLSYSPYDNVRPTDYPHMLVTSGLHDSQVQYWEPAKWVARLRVMKTDPNLLLLKTNMEAGHGGASGRFNALKEVAFRQAFFLKLAGVTE